MVMSETMLSRAAEYWRNQQVLVAMASQYCDSRRTLILEVQEVSEDASYRINGELAEALILHDGNILDVHPATQCALPDRCSVHNPSDHPLKDAPYNWRNDRGLMERICEHGVGHPDPDDLAYKKAVIPNYEDYEFGVHGCDGCCHPKTED